MDQALLPEKIASGKEESSPIRWVLLPGLCCQAAGGDPAMADDLASAWFLFYSAAHLMDSLEDRDDPNPWWEKMGMGAAINVASGLYFSASLAINSLCKKQIVAESGAEITQDFYHTMLAMCAGQQRDLSNSSPGLDQYWEIAAEKSGLFFALACRSGARLVIQDPSRLDGFRLFGHHLGILIQILDDLEDWHDAEAQKIQLQGDKLPRSLPVVYALEVLPSADRLRLRRILQENSDEENLWGEFHDLVERSGAAIYLMTEIERHKDLAKLGLDQAAPLPQVGEKLTRLLNGLTTKE